MPRDSRNWRLRCLALAPPQYAERNQAAAEEREGRRLRRRDVFFTAGEAWLRCRAGNDKPERFGQGATKGLWFMKVNVVRDAFAVNNRKTSSWDRWREAPPELRTVSHDELAALDSLSRNSEAAVALMPPWLTPPDWLGPE